jgi:hypothetical protein
MAITAQKLLGSSSIIKSSKSSLAPSSGGALIRVEKKVIKINNLVKNNLLLQKKGGQLAIREKENTDLEKKEKDLEKQKPKGLSGIKIPKLPGFGFMGWIKNWIFKTLLGFITVRLIDYLPKMINFVSIAGPAMDGILNFSGMLLNGMISFVDAGYKAVDATRGLVGKTFGNDALKNFDKLAGELEKFMNLAIIVGMASAGFGMDRLGKKGAKKSAEKGAGTLARRGASRVATRAGAKLGGKTGAKLGAKLGSKALKAIPILGAGAAIIEGIMRIRDGDYIGGLLSFGSVIPVAGWAFLAVDIAREFGILKFAGGGYVTRPKKYAGGGATPPIRRKVSKVKRKVSAKAPITKVKPGASVGGKRNIVKIFPEPENKNKSKQTNPLGYLEGSATSLGKAPNFGPLFTIAMKTVLGEKPTLTDYKNAGIGLNAWAANSITNVGGFSGGGEVDGRMLFAGKDMSDAIAKSIQTSVSSEVDKTIKDLAKQLSLQSTGYYMESMKEVTGPAGQPGQMAPGSVAGGQLTVEQLVGLAKGAGFSDNEAVIMAAIAMGESGGNSSRTNFVPPDKSYGLWQINMIGGLGPARLKEFGLSSESQLLDPVTNAKAAYAIRKSQGLSAWTVYKDGTYKNFLRQAQAARGAPSLAKSPVSGGSINSKSIVEYITGDPNTPVGRFDRSGHGSPTNYHDHIAFATIQDKENAKSILRAAGIQIGSEYRPGDRGYHGSNLAIDVPGHQWKGSGTIGQKEYNGSARVRQILGLGISKFAVGGRVSKPVFALIGEKGQEFVFDADTTKGMDQMMPGLLEHLNAAKTKPQLASILNSYSDDPGMILIPPASSSSPSGGRSGGGGGTSSGSVNRQDNSWMFDRLATGTG